MNPHISTSSSCSPANRETHQRADFRQVFVRPLILRHSLDTSRLDAEFGDCSLDVGIWGVARHKDFP